MLPSHEDIWWCVGSLTRGAVIESGPGARMLEHAQLIEHAAQRPHITLECVGLVLTDLLIPVKGFRSHKVSFVEVPT